MSGHSQMSLNFIVQGNDKLKLVNYVISLNSFKPL